MIDDLPILYATYAKIPRTIVLINGLYNLNSSARTFINEVRNVLNSLAIFYFAIINRIITFFILFFITIVQKLNDIFVVMFLSLKFLIIIILGNAGIIFYSEGQNWIGRKY
jgi:phage-related minor tail protein